MINILVMKCQRSPLTLMLLSYRVGIPWVIRNQVSAHMSILPQLMTDTGLSKIFYTFCLSSISYCYQCTLFLAHLSRRLKWAIVIARRPSVVVHKLSHFQLLLQNHLMDFDETWYAWSTHGPLQVLLFFGQIGPLADPGRGKNRSQGVPFFKKLLLQTRRLQRQTECIAMT